MPDQEKKIKNKAEWSKEDFRKYLRSHRFQTKSFETREERFASKETHMSKND